MCNIYIKIMIDIETMKFVMKEFAEKYNFIQQIDIEKVETEEDFNIQNYLKLDNKTFISINEYTDKTEVVCGKINIEIDGFHHHLDPYQALQDLKRTYYSFQKGYFTIRVPNSLIENKLDDAVEYILKFLNDSIHQY